MRVALLNPPKFQAYYPPQDPALMSALLKRAGHEVRVFDANVELYAKRGRDYDDAWTKTHGIAAWWNAQFVESFMAGRAAWAAEFFARLARFRPDAVVLNVIPTSVQACRTFVPLLRARLPAARLVLAGKMCHRVRNPRTLLDLMPEADAVVAGEFDETLPALIGRWAEGDDGACPGVIERRGGGIVDHGDRPDLKDLDGLPDFDWAAFPLELYGEPGVLRWSTSRGCVRRCIFCEQTIWEGARRAPSAERLAGEIERQLERSPDLWGFYFDDIVINAEPERLEKFCVLLAGIRRRRLSAQFARIPAADLAAGKRPQFSWTCQGIVDERRMKPSLLRAMAEAGCVQITYGVESGSPRVVKSMRKGFTIPEAERVIRATSEAGIAVHIHYLPGFPTETKEDFEDSLRFLERNRRWLAGVDAGVGCYIAPFTPLGLEPGRYGVQEPVHPSYWRTRDGLNTFPVRWSRRDRFFRSAKRLGLSMPPGWRFDSPDKWIFHRDYYKHIGDDAAARRCERRLRNFSSWKAPADGMSANLAMALDE